MQKIDNSALPATPSTAAAQPGAEGGASLPNAGPYGPGPYGPGPYDRGELSSESFSIGLDLI